MKKILLVLTLTTLIFACKKEDDKPTTTTPTEIEGCIDTLAINFDPTATEDDGSCVYAEEVEGCMDTIAVNYNPSATIDDGSCEYIPTSLILSSITINTMPLTNNGSDWDIGLFGSENPDVFYVLKEGSDEVFSSSSQDNIDACPISFTEGLPYTITNLSQEFTIELWDNDQVAGIGENELMGSCSFTPNDFVTDAGSGINIINEGIDITLAIQWVQ